MKHQGYYTRALRARDPRFARVFGKMGYDTTELVADDEGPSLADLRASYEKALGKRPFNGWNAETLAEKIAEAQKAS